MPLKAKKIQKALAIALMIAPTQAHAIGKNDKPIITECIRDFYTGEVLYCK